MVYQLTTKGKILRLTSVIVIGLLIIPAFWIAMETDTEKGSIFCTFLIFLFLTLTLPQLFLFSQYSDVTEYEQFELDEDGQQFIFSIDKRIEKRSFSEIKSIVHYKPVVPIYLGSLVLFLCKHFYYYKIEFEGETYYITSLLDPQPVFKNSVLEERIVIIETAYARIRK